MILTPFTTGTCRNQMWSECDQSQVRIIFLKTSFASAAGEIIVFYPPMQWIITTIWTARLWSLNNQHNGQNVGLITVTAKVQNQTNSPERTNWSQLVSIGWRKWTPAQIRIDPIGVENASWRSHWVQKWNLMLRLEKMQKSKALTWQLSVGWD